ncbi:protein SGT1 homolog isoform X2 [Copidosoma floridanum]|uniref:protein SGT1 homolog isoform X2 n=1 Tax=Copidosoma floridanum TaxID=29053 RepID=UPI0006C93BEF|nr:protein SGT1 homolog isoform X2 [Copidosoma floridanum]
MEKESIIVSKVRYDWYQTEAFVYVIVLAKNTDDITVTYSEKSLNVTAKLPSNEYYNLKVELQHSVVPEQCSYKVTRSTIEIKLKKQVCMMWAVLEVKQQSTKYPSSCKNSKDWDEFEREIDKQEAEEKSDGEDALNALFQQIYGKGSDDVRRAMNKSFNLVAQYSVRIGQKLEKERCKENLQMAWNKNEEFECWSVLKKYQTKMYFELMSEVMMMNWTIRHSTLSTL